MTIINGIPVSDGVAIGPVCLEDNNETASAGSIDDKDQLNLFEDALIVSRSQIESLVASSSDSQQSEIFEAHLLMLEDPELVDNIRDSILQGNTVKDAVQVTVDNIVAVFESMQDDYLRARAADIRDIGNRLIRNIEGKDRTVPDGSVYVAVEVFASDIPMLQHASGVVTEKGGITSHAAILLRSAGIPAVFGAQDVLQKASSGIDIIVNGTTGEVVLNPDTEAISRNSVDLRGLGETALKDAFSGIRGEEFLIKANIGNVEDSIEAVKAGADGIGLLRTEFLFSGRETMPSEEEQFAVYKEIVCACNGKPVTIRTLDAGSDKPLSFVPIPKEANPALGMRGIRVSLAMPDLFGTQLRAILRAAAFGPVTVLFPMVTNTGELDAAENALCNARNELKDRGESFGDVKTGAMIETPASALMAPDIASKVDYLSIGSNDLTQYTLAVDRTNSEVASLYDETSPAVLELIRLTVMAGKFAGTAVCVCGEMASRPAVIAKLIDIGIREISVSPAFISSIRSAVP